MDLGWRTSDRSRWHELFDSSTFHLPEHLTAKADPTVITGDEQHFAAIAETLEFDLVVLIDPQAFGEGTEGAVDRYVAMTRATQQLVILTSR